MLLLRGNHVINNRDLSIIVCTECKKSWSYHINTSCKKKYDTNFSKSPVCVYITMFHMKMETTYPFNVVHLHWHIRNIYHLYLLITSYNMMPSLVLCNLFALGIEPGAFVKRMFTYSLCHHCMLRIESTQSIMMHDSSFSYSPCHSPNTEHHD